MSFVALNADEVDPSVAPQHHLKYEGVRREYEQVLSLCRGNDLHAAWKHLTGLLEGELFAAGPSFQYQPALREIQKSTLLLAVDLSKRLQDESLFDLLLETIDWFPEEAFFWLQLAEATPGDYRGAIIKRLALYRAARLLPLDRDIKRQIQRLGAALGRPDKGLDWANNERPYGPLESMDIMPVRIEVHAASSIDHLIERICEVAEDLLEIGNHSQRRRNGGHSFVLDRVRLSHPIEVVINFDGQAPEAEERATPVCQAEDANTLQLSQAGSQRNLGEFSQTRRRRLRQRETPEGVPKDSRMSLQEYVKRLIEALDDLKMGEAEESVINLAFEIEKAMNQSARAAFRVLEECEGEGIRVTKVLSKYPHLRFTLIQALVNCVVWLDDAGYTLNPRPSYTGHAKRLSAALLCSQSDVDYVIDHLTGPQLLWLAECSKTFSTSTKEVLDYLLPRVWLKINPVRDPSLVVRYLWLRSHSQGDPQDIAQAEAILNARAISVVPLFGTFDGKQMTVVSAESLSLEKSHTGMKLLLDQALSAEDSRKWLEDNHITGDPIQFLRDNPISLEQAPEWCLLLLGKAQAGTLAEGCIVIIGLCAAANKRPDLVKQFISHPHFAPLLGSLSQRQRPFFEFLAGEFGTTREFLVGLVRALGSNDANALTHHAEFLILILRDILERDVLGQSRTLLEELSRGLAPTDTSSRILLYCALSLLLDAPWLDLTDEWGLCRHLTGLSLKDGLSVASLSLEHLPLIIRLASVANTLISGAPVAGEVSKEGEEVQDMPLRGDPLRVISFCDHLLNLIFTALGSNRQYKYCLATLEGALLRSINTTRLPSPPFTLSSYPETSSTVGALFALKQRAIRDIPPSTAFIKRRRSIDGLRESIEEAHCALLLRQETQPVELLEYLGSLYDAELRLLLVGDADRIFTHVARIKGLIRGVHNIHRLIRDTIPASELSFYQSIHQGILSLFLSAVERAHIGAFLWERSLATDDWLSLILKSLAVRLIGKRTRDPYLALRLQADGLLALATEHGNRVPSTLHAVSTLYGLALDTLWMLLNLYKEDVHSSLASTLLARLNRALLPIDDGCSNDSGGGGGGGGGEGASERVMDKEDMSQESSEPSPEGQAQEGDIVKQQDLEEDPRAQHSSTSLPPSPFLDQMVCLIHRLASHLDRKGTQHRHLALLARIDGHVGGEAHTLSAVRSAWAKLIPIVLKPKSNLVLAVWQNDQDYPGDYHWYGELYFRQAARDITEGGDGAEGEKAKILALLISRIISAPALFVRRRLLIRDLLQLFHAWIERERNPPLNQANSLEAFVHRDEQSLRAVYEDAVQMAIVGGLYTPDKGSGYTGDG